MIITIAIDTDEDKDGLKTLEAFVEAFKQKEKSPAKKELTQAEKDANWKKKCDELRAEDPETFDAFLKNHAIKKIMDIKTSECRAKFVKDMTATINAAKEAENG